MEASKGAPALRLRKVLVANRGEIACRVFRTCRALGLRTVAVYSTADRNALHVREADEAVFIGESPAPESYLRIPVLIEAAKRVGADAIHPGYGFLSENADFSAACHAAGIVFVGPSAESIRAMGSKSSAKQLLRKHAPDVPVIPGYDGEDQSIDRLSQEALRVGFPVLLKASAGGGGKGMRVVRSAEELRTAIDSAQRESQNAFGDSKLLIERYFEGVRHVEIQIFGDQHGNVIHLFERECTLQRRHQKVVEESPSVFLDEGLRARMGAAAVKAGKVIGYCGAGTVEFIVAADRSFYFLEVNTRLQVEHPVTELVVGLDLVALQLEVAAGGSLQRFIPPAPGQPAAHPLRQRGWAVEVRLYAENPSNQFLPCVGRVLQWRPSLAEGVRIDSGLYAGWDVSVFYDPLLAKMIAYGPTRDGALDRLVLALRKTVCLGLVNNCAFLISCLDHPEFRAGRMDTGFIAQHYPEPLLQAMALPPVPAQIAAALADWRHRERARTLLRNVPSGFRVGPAYKPTLVVLAVDAAAEEMLCMVEYTVERVDKAAGVAAFKVSVGGHAFDVALLALNEQVKEEDDFLPLVVNGVQTIFHVARLEAYPAPRLFVHSDAHGTHAFTRRPRLPYKGDDDAEGQSGYASKMPGRVLELLVADGATVKKGDALLVTYSMKIETKLHALTDGTVHFRVKAGDLFDDGQVLLEVK